MGTSDEDALAALGEPEERTSEGESRETWRYCQRLDDPVFQTVVMTLVTFEAGRLVDWRVYRFL